MACWLPCEKAGQSNASADMTSSGGGVQDEKQQRAASTVRKTALACLKKLMHLLCGEGPHAFAKPKLQALLIADMAGSGSKEAAAGSVPPRLLRTPQSTVKPAAGQASHTVMLLHTLMLIMGLKGVGPLTRVWCID